MPKINIPVTDSLVIVFPEAAMISFLPRKKKKALKKELGRKVANWLMNEITKEELITEIQKHAINHG
jgi:hypothetical protein